MVHAPVGDHHQQLGEVPKGAPFLHLVIVNLGKVQGDAEGFCSGNPSELRGLLERRSERSERLCGDSRRTHAPPPGTAGCMAAARMCTPALCSTRRSFALSTGEAKPPTLIQGEALVPACTCQGLGLGLGLR